jgi:hypothetical protein
MAGNIGLLGLSGDARALMQALHSGAADTDASASRLLTSARQAHTLLDQRLHGPD